MVTIRTDEAEPFEPSHVAVLAPAGTVFALLVDGELTLPVVNVPRGTRPAPYIASAVADAYGLEVFCLTDLARYDTDHLTPRTMLAELCEPSRALPANACWADPSRVRIGQRLLHDLVDACAHEGRETERPGFCQRLRQWVRSALAASDPTARRELTGHHRQWNAGRGFCLTRLETTGAAVWFKAVGSPNEAEFHIAACVAERHPNHSPRVLASHDIWRGWLTEELAGPSLREAGVDAWIESATAMAALQLENCDHVESWVRHGCADLHVTTLDRNVDAFFDGMAAVFARQLKASPPPLRRSELDATADALHRAIEIAAGLPSTLVHADLNPDNVFFRDRRAVFLDWAGASVGFPLTALENMCGHLRRARPGDDAASERVRQAYCDVWRPACGAAVVDRAISVAPMLYYATLAMRCAGWLWKTDTPAVRDPLLRSLSRSMYHAALAPAH